ncbi:MAG: Ldh family oxidoreductase [Clostridiaceae bacterium]|jgi:LDH2 family malate/lactate/ureidoglycolate dehydrogenase|nr:Ldh family oxidoreductase [Clostridiaceae bacterium]
MSDEVKYIRISRDKLEKYTSDIFAAAGMIPEEADIVAKNLVQADLTGKDTHGVMRVPAYIKRIENKGTFARSEIEIVKEDDTTALIDGHNGMGQVISTAAMKLCIEKAKKAGVAFVGVRGSNHFGIAAYYAEMALDCDMIGITVTSPAALLLAPTGGIEPILDNNPFSFAIPSGKRYPVILDMATSVVSRGRIAVAAKKGKKIPMDWAMTKDGIPTDDPVEGFNGILLPVGGYKGYGLTVIAGIMSAVLNGGSILSTEIKDFYSDVSEQQNIGHLFGAIDISRFIGIDAFKEKMDEMINEIKNSKRAPGVDEIFLPGEHSYRNAERNGKEGIPIIESVIDDINDIGLKYGLDPIKK